MTTEDRKRGRGQKDRETAALLRAMSWSTIRGNHERQLLALPADRMGPADAFARARLAEEDLHWLAALPATRRVGSKPLAVEGREEVFDPWEHPVPGVRYNYLQAGVQLANRTGALNEIEYSEFVMKAQRYADAVGGAPEFPDMLHEVARARELDQFAGQHDAQLGFTLRARGSAWSPGFVHQQAARLGFVAGVIPGRMVLPSSEPGLPPVLDLSFDPQAALSEDPAHSAIQEVTLNLDVPQVHRNEQPFARLRDAAFALAEGMGGVITDDAGQPLRPEMIDTIGADLERLYDTLDEHDLAAGSAQARRLFS